MVFCINTSDADISASKWQAEIYVKKYFKFFYLRIKKENILFLSLIFF